MEALNLHQVQLKITTHDNADDGLEEEEFENPFHGCATRKDYFEQEDRWDSGFHIEIQNLHEHIIGVIFNKNKRFKRSAHRHHKTGG